VVFETTGHDPIWDNERKWPDKQDIKVFVISSEILKLCFQYNSGFPCSIESIEFGQNVH